MEGDLLSLGMEVMQAVNEIEESNFGPVTETNMQIKMNEIDEEAGIGVKAQFMFAGPTLDHLKEHGSVLFPDKSDDDFFVVLSIRVKGDPQETIDEIKGIIESFGLPLDMLEQFGELKFHPGDGEVLIGFKLAESEYAQMAKTFTVEPKVFGDGSEEITAEFSFNMGASFNEMLDDTPLVMHLLKSESVHIRTRLHEKTRENIIKVLAEKKEQLEPIIDMAPPAVALLLFKKLDGVLEFQCTDEMKQKLQDTIQNNMPMATSPLKDLLQMVPMMVPSMDMVQPIIELLSNKFAGEISVSGVTATGWKVTVRLPGIDQVAAALLENM